MLVSLLMLMFLNVYDENQETVTSEDCSTVNRELSLISWAASSDTGGAGLK